MFKVGDRVVHVSKYTGVIVEHAETDPSGEYFFVKFDLPLDQSPVYCWNKQLAYQYPSEMTSAPPVAVSKYHDAAKEVADLVTTKNEKYGDSFNKAGAVMRQLYPDGVTPAQLDDALVIVRILDKLFRIATAKDAFGENPYADICGYALLGMTRCGE